MVYRLPGGQTSLLGNRGQIKGVYAEHPASSPKYHTGNTSKAVGQQARMFIEVNSPAAYAEYVNSIQGNKRAQELARVLAAGRTSDKRTANATPGLGYVDFLLTQFGEQRQELSQVTDVLADAYVHYVFGQTAPRVSLSGWVLNTKQDNWYDAFHILYDELIRGTKLATRNQILIVRVDTRLYFCTPIANSMQLSAEMEMAGQFSLQVVVKRITFLDRRHDNQKPTNLRKLGFSSLFRDVSSTALNSALEVFQVQKDAEAADTADEIIITEEELLLDEVRAEDPAMADFLSIDPEG